MEKHCLNCRSCIILGNHRIHITGDIYRDTYDIECHRHPFQTGAFEGGFPNRSYVELSYKKMWCDDFRSKDDNNELIEK